MPGPYDVAVISSGHDVADARIHKIVAAMTARGLAVEVFGLGEVNDGPRGATVHAVPRGSMASRALRALRLPGRASARVLFTVDPDTVIPARVIGRLRGRKVVADVHEDYGKLLADRAWARGPAGLIGRIVAYTSAKCAASADITVVTDDRMPPREARRRLVVRNLPALDLLPQPGVRGSQPRAVYIGDLRRSRGLFDMVDAVAAAPEWELDLVGPVAALDEDALHTRLSSNDAAGRIRWHGRLPPGPAWQVADGAWAGLLMLHDTPAFREAMPTKLYEYMAMGFAVITTPLPRQAAVVRESGAGVAVTGAAEAADVLRGWAKDPAVVDRHRRAALDWAEREILGEDPYGRLADAVAELVATAAGP